MIQVKKKSKARLLIILAAVMAVLIAGYFVLTALLPEQGQEPETPKFDQLPWEGNGQQIFPSVDTGKVDYITLEASEGAPSLSYGLEKQDDGTFALWYLPEKDSTVEDAKWYMPDIVAKDPSFTYSSLYAMDSFGQGQVARFLYLRSAITTMYFTERISLKELTVEQRRAYLEEFGFMDFNDYGDDSDDEMLGVTVGYGTKTEDGDKQLPLHTIWVGGKNASGNGYYVIVLDEQKGSDAQPGDYIYATNNSNIGYTTKDYTYYINPGVISAGLSSDQAWEPYLISDYQQWKNDIVYTPGAAIDPDAEVTVNATVTLPKDHTSGGLESVKESSSFQLGELSKKAAYKRLVEILKLQGLSGIKNYGTEEEEILSLASPVYITLTTEGLTLNFPEGKNVMECRYEITKILSALTESDEVTSGPIPADATGLRVAYNLYTKGEGGAEKKVNSEEFYAVLSLSDDRIDATEKAALIANGIGNVNNCSLNIAFDQAAMDLVPISDKNCHRRVTEYFVADVIAIYDEQGKAMTEITEESIVVYRYYLVINGKEEKEYLTAADRVSKMDDDNKALFLSFGGKGNGFNQRIRTDVKYLDVMADYISYEIDAIPYMITRTEVVHFNFIKSQSDRLERFPFYGESIYENTTGGKYSLYGLNNSACQSVLLHLGGAGESTTSTVGYAGDETVAVGLTPELMRKYGLYAHTIYYELPRGIVGIEDSSTAESDDPNDYDWPNVLGFTVYISDKQDDGSRYLASDLYEVIVRVTDEKLDFVEYSFVDFWARQQLAMVDSTRIDKLAVSFNFDDLKGDYTFIRDILKSYDPNSQQTKELLEFIVRPSSDAFDTKMKQLLAQSGKEELGLRFLYNLHGPEEYFRGGVCAVDNQFAGTAFFREVLGMMFTTMYAETYTETEQAQILESAPLLGSIVFDLTADSFEYTYEFYRASDRRVLVKFYKVNATTGERTEAVSDFAISTSVFKKIMGGFVTVLNAGKVSGDDPYYDLTGAQ